MSLEHPITRSHSTSAESIISIRSTTMRHPTPGLQSLQGAYKGNITRLERSAEELSQAGSDIAEEIRKLHEEEKEKDRSRQNSLQSSLNQGETNARPIRIGRTVSQASSRANSSSIIDINGNARWGGYSPLGFVTSPVGSVTSGSWQSPAQTQSFFSVRVPSTAELMQEGQMLDSPSALSPHTPHSASHRLSFQPSQPLAQIPQGVTPSNYAFDIPDFLSPPAPTTEDSGHVDSDAAEAAQPTSAQKSRPHSTDTYQEAELAFRDFDGVHFSPDTEEYVELDGHGNEVRRVSARTSSGSLLDPAVMLKQPPPQPMSHGLPPPQRGMVYYPAPVPRMLNLPKRISQMPPQDIQAKKRSQLLSHLGPAVRESAMWLTQPVAEEGPPQIDFDEEMQPQARPQPKNRMSRQDLSDIPAHLRASMFFEHPSVPHDVQIKAESAVATLDSILAASATAPVSAFTDHPFAGDVRKTVYALEKIPKRSSTNLNALAKAGGDNRVSRRRSASVVNLLRRQSLDAGDQAATLRQRPSKISLLAGSDKLKRRQSAYSLGDVDDLAARNEYDRGLDDEENLSDDDYEQVDDLYNEEDDHDDDDDDDGAMYVQPSTLLAELQVRKAQQKSRNRTAITAYPNGMHSTLLELDAVEEINRKKRRNNRVALAWEDPNLQVQELQRQGDDDNVPLAMLFPAKDGLVKRALGDTRDWQRPLGLMEKKHLEDNEPLSSRRNRLQGLPVPPPLRQSATLSRIQLTNASVDALDSGVEGNANHEQIKDEDEDEFETLGQRQRRMKTKSVLDNAIADVATTSKDRPVSTFTNDVFGAVGIADNDANAHKDTLQPPTVPVEQSTTPGIDENETLGQRRARLQREKDLAVAQGVQPARPALRSTQSMANILATNPVGMRANAAASRSHAPAAGTLLHTNAQIQSRHKQELLNTNMRSSSYVADRPTLNGRSNTGFSAQGFRSTQYNQPFMGTVSPGMYNQISMPGLPMQIPIANPNFMAVGYPQSFAMQPQSNRANMVDPLAYSALNGGRMSYVTPQASMMSPSSGSYAQQQQMNMGLAANQTLPTGQRAAIDRWRMSVAQ